MDFSSIRPQFLSARAFSSILTVFPNITATIKHIAADLSTITAKLTSVDAYFSAVGSQFATLPAINSALCGGYATANTNGRDKQCQISH
jgi:hypothetical protein